MQTYLFPGGIKLEPHKALSLAQPIKILEVPRRLVVPLAQSAGQAVRAQVRVGERVLRGQVIGAAGSAVPVHAPSSGIVSAIARHAVVHASGASAECITIECDGLDEGIELSADPHWQERDALELIGRIHAAGVVGLGGGVFSTAQKLKSAPSLSLKHLILNGAECEPYIACDNALLSERAEQLIEGARMLQHVLRPQRLTIALEDNMLAALAALKACAAEFEIVALPARYPEGGERQLIYALTKLEVPAQGLPLDIGMLVVNVASAVAAWRAVRFGEPLISRIVTLSGAGVRHPGNFEVRIGTLIGDLVEQAGGYSEDAERLLIGGSMMGLSLPNDQYPISKGVNCVLLLPPAGTAREPEMPCIRCGECARVCPVVLQPQLLQLAVRAADSAALERLKLKDCIDCGLCAVVCPSQIPLAKLFFDSKQAFKISALQAREAALAKARFEARNLRLQAIVAQRAERAASVGADTAAREALARVRARKPATSEGP